MEKTFDTVDMKVAEAEFFLRKMAGCGFDLEEFQFYFSAYLSASRTVTLALQQFKDLDGFEAWYAPHQEKLKKNQTAKFFLNTRNSHVHGGGYPIRGGSSHGRTHTFHFFDYDHNDVELGDDDVLARSRSFFLSLIEIVYDCYVELGPQIDPQQFYTKEHFGGSIDQAEAQIYGWIMTSFIDEGFSEDDRWSELRSRLDSCKINHLFKAYLGKVTPQPVEPEHYQDFEPSDEDRGWVHIPAGFKNIEEWMGFIKQERSAQQGSGGNG
ncbi:hypothetical protein [Cerasicoccus frondis]|uniref:hypothetical protein n=1 Tax=Cerasicoccus frondis TaxID=490090 RepID=UPI002852B94B|nr:hypothetical protein [Cerasicoccus frondis]